MWRKLASSIRLWPGGARNPLDRATAAEAAGLVGERARVEGRGRGHFEVKGHELAFRPEVMLSERVADFEAREIAAVLDRHRGNTLKAAETLGLPRRTLNDKMRRYGLQ